MRHGVKFALAVSQPPFPSSARPFRDDSGEGISQGCSHGTYPPARPPMGWTCGENRGRGEKSNLSSRMPLPPFDPSLRLRESRGAQTAGGGRGLVLVGAHTRSILERTEWRGSEIGSAGLSLQLEVGIWCLVSRGPASRDCVWRFVLTPYSCPKTRGQCPHRRAGSLAINLKNDVSSHGSYYLASIT